jgi:hypothetical protein
MEPLDERHPQEETSPSDLPVDSIEDPEEELDDDPSLSHAAHPSLPRRKYRPKGSHLGDAPHANTISTMPDYERRKEQEQRELDSGRVNLRRVDAESMFF